MSTATLNNVVNWSEVFNVDSAAIVDFAEGNLTFRNFQRNFNGAARQEVNKLKDHDADYRRVLARRACRRRRIPVVTS